MHTLHLTLAAYYPQCIINDYWVLTKNGNVLSKDIFTVDARKYLPHLSVIDYHNQ